MTIILDRLELLDKGDMMGPAIDTNTGIFETIDILKRENERLTTCFNGVCRDNLRLNNLIVEATRQRNSMFEYSAAVTSKEAKVRDENGELQDYNKVLQGRLTNVKKHLDAVEKKRAAEKAAHDDQLAQACMTRTYVGADPNELDAARKQLDRERHEHVETRKRHNAEKQRMADNWTAQIKEEREKQSAIMLDLLKAQKRNEQMEKELLKLATALA